MRTYVDANPMVTVVRAVDCPPGFRRAAGAVVKEVAWLAVWVALAVMAGAVAMQVPDADAAGAGWVLTGLSVGMLLDQLFNAGSLLFAVWRERRRGDRA